MDSLPRHHNRQWQSKITRPIITDANRAEVAVHSGITLINSQSVLEVKGPDAEKFLQGQCSADISNLKEKQGLPGCICTVKGRVLCTFIATKSDDRILLKMTADLVAPMHEYLSKYAAFFKAELIEWPTPCVIESPLKTSLKTTALPLSYKLNDTEFCEYIVEPVSLEAVLEELNNSDVEFFSEERWSDKQIDCGWLNLTSETSEKYLPHQLNLERLNAISFTKGCYTGQEIIARTEYRGKPKRRMHLIELQSPDESENTGAGAINYPADLTDPESGKALGILLAVSSNGEKGLAILPVDNQGTLLADLDAQNISLNVPEQPYPSETS